MFLRWFVQILVWLISKLPAQQLTNMIYYSKIIDWVNENSTPVYLRRIDSLHSVIAKRDAQVLDLEHSLKKLRREFADVQEQYTQMQMDHKQLQTIVTELQFDNEVLTRQAQEAKVAVATVQREVFTRMDAEVYEHFERTVQANALVTGSTSDIEAGFKLGVMHVLYKLRAGYVIPRSN